MSMPLAFQNRLSIPVIGSPLFIISGPELVMAQCRAGIIGSFPSLNARPLGGCERVQQAFFALACSGFCY